MTAAAAWSVGRVSLRNGAHAKDTKVQAALALRLALRLSAKWSRSIQSFIRLMGINVNARERVRKISR